MNKIPTCYGCMCRSVVIDFVRGISVKGLCRKYELQKVHIKEIVRLYMPKKGRE